MSHFVTPQVLSVLMDVHIETPLICIQSKSLIFNIKKTITWFHLRVIQGCEEQNETFGSFHRLEVLQSFRQFIDKA